MKCVITSVVVALSMLATFSSASPLERVKRQNIQGLVIPREFQNINFENYLKNPRAVQFQLKCVIYDGPCDSIGKYLKANFPNWLKTQCKNCNAGQKKQAGKAIEFFQSNYPKEWNDAVKKYRGTFDEDDVKRFESELGIKVNFEAPIPAGGPPKPDSAGLAALAREAIQAAKTTSEPLVFESRPTKGSRVIDDVSTTAASTSTSTTEAPAPAAEVSSSSSVAPVSEAVPETTVAETESSTNEPQTTSS